MAGPTNFEDIDVTKLSLDDKLKYYQLKKFIQEEEAIEMGKRQQAAVRESVVAETKKQREQEEFKQSTCDHRDPNGKVDTVAHRRPNGEMIFICLKCAKMWDLKTMPPAFYPTMDEVSSGPVAGIQ